MLLLGKIVFGNPALGGASGTGRRGKGEGSRGETCKKNGRKEVYEE